MLGSVELVSWQPASPDIIGEPLCHSVKGPFSPHADGNRGHRNLSDAELMELDQALKSMEPAVLRDVGPLSQTPNLPLVLTLYTLYA